MAVQAIDYGKPRGSGSLPEDPVDVLPRLATNSETNGRVPLYSNRETAAHARHVMLHTEEPNVRHLRIRGCWAA